MRKFDFTENENSAGQPQGPLMFILSKRSLKWAWYLSLLLLIIYMIFIGKRRQRVIPVVESVKNTSLEYIKTVGKLYFMENDHRSIAIHKMKQFQTFLRTRYFILTTQRNDLLAEKIATVSGVDVTLVKEIFLQFSLIEVHEKISEEEFLNFHKLLTEFYKSSV
jgi:hypothetical protein